MKDSVGRVLVAGAGVSGIRSALDLARMGVQVLLIDRADHTGGLLSQLDTQFPSQGCGFCRGLPMVDRDRSSQSCLRKGFAHDNIEILLSTQIMSIEGEAGNFTVTLKQGPAMIDPERCIGCGQCEPVCPVETKDFFNAGMTRKKAVYLPVPQSFSNAWTIDSTACTRCGECVKVCPVDAIRLTGQDRERFKVLVVDDEAIVRESTREWLKEEGFFTAAADSGQKALELLAEGAEKEQPFSMMLTDIKMPGMDGVELLTRAKEISPDLTVIMMTAYAAVDSAVDAMKLGAMDYLTKPFDPDVLVAMTLEVFQEYEMAKARSETVDAVILSAGARLFEPERTKNAYGYGSLPGVVTSLELERMLSPAGPAGMDFLHPARERPLEKIAWFQCVGSRDVQDQAPFCSSACCMISIKQAVLVQKQARKSGRKVETVIFYMDMRTMGKPFEQYRQQARDEYGVRFVRARIHSLGETADSEHRRLMARYTDDGGALHEEGFDLVALAVGTRPGRQMEEISRANQIQMNAFGFVEPQAFSLVQTSREGIFAAGTVTGFNDISDSVVSASAAAMAAAKALSANGTPLWKPLDDHGPALLASLSRQIPQIGIILSFNEKMDEPGFKALKADLERDPDVVRVEAREEFDLDRLAEFVDKFKCNRLIIGLCRPREGSGLMKSLQKATRLPDRFIEVLDISRLDNARPHTRLSRALKVRVSRLKFFNPMPVESLAGQVPEPSALVIGGGIAGMTASRCMADAGFKVDLVEKGDALGGNLRWMAQTPLGHDIQAFLEDQVKKVESHENIMVYKNSAVEGAVAVPGGFTSFLSRKTSEPDAPDNFSVTHAVTLLATGGSQAPLPESDFTDGTPNAVTFTQEEFQKALTDGQVAPEKLDTVVMVQCSGTRTPATRNYCSRICCVRALKTALDLKEKNPDMMIFILYRDMMSFGFMEDLYTRAREKGVLFIQYEPDQPPRVDISPEGVTVTARDHVLNRPVQIQSDAVIHATGIEPDLPRGLAELYGAGLDEFNFFKEADYKFRPVDSMNYRVFSCGLCLKPSTIDESITQAQAAAARALQILGPERLRSGRVVAHTRTATCTVCEMCVNACPYAARSVDPIEDKIVIDPLACQGCGVCAAVCPSDSAILEGFTAQHMFDTIDQMIMDH